MFKRLALFLATNIAVLLVLGTVLGLLGFSGMLDEQRIGIDYTALLTSASPPCGRRPGWAEIRRRQATRAGSPS